VTKSDPQLVAMLLQLEPLAPVLECLVLVQLLEVEARP